MHGRDNSIASAPKWGPKLSDSRRRLFMCTRGNDDDCLPSETYGRSPRPSRLRFVRNNLTINGRASTFYRYARRCVVNNGSPERIFWRSRRRPEIVVVFSSDTPRVVKHVQPSRTESPFPGVSRSRAVQRYSAEPKGLAIIRREYSKRA